MYNALLKVGSHKRKITYISFEYFRPFKKCNPGIYLHFLFKNFTYPESPWDANIFLGLGITSVEPTWEDKVLQQRAIEESYLYDGPRNLYNPEYFLSLEGKHDTDKENYYYYLTRLRYEAGLDKDLIPNLDNLYFMERRPHESCSQELQKDPLGGLFRIEFESTVDNSFFYQWLVEGKMENGEIEFLSEDEKQSNFVISFWDCYCIEVEDIFRPEEPVPMRMRVLLSPAITLNRGVWHLKDWKVTDVMNDKKNAYEGDEIIAPPTLVVTKNLMFKDDENPVK